MSKKIRFICVKNGCWNHGIDYKEGEIFEVLEGSKEEVDFRSGYHFFKELDENYIAYFNVEGSVPLQRLIERLQNDMVPVEGFDYPFSISRRKLSQEDYAVIMDVGHFYNEEVPVGADCPYVTNKWNVWSAYHSEQNWGEIPDILKKLEEKTGRRFRLPTIKECEYVNSKRNEELGFRIKDELCMADSYYLCTESGDYYVSNPMSTSDDYPSYISFRLVECHKPLSEIKFEDAKVVKGIQDILSDDADDMHYFWEN